MSKRKCAYQPVARRNSDGWVSLAYHFSSKMARPLCTLSQRRPMRRRQCCISSRSCCVCAFTVNVTQPFHHEIGMEQLFIFGHVQGDFSRSTVNGKINKIVSFVGACIPSVSVRRFFDGKVLNLVRNEPARAVNSARMHNIVLQQFRRLCLVNYCVVNIRTTWKVFCLICFERNQTFRAASVNGTTASMLD